MSRKACFLRSGNDALEDAKFYHTKSAAVRKFKRDAEELDRIGQEHGAAIHYANNVDELQEYPDYVLSLGPRGGVREEKA